MNTIAASTRRVPRAALIGIVVLTTAFAALMIVRSGVIGGSSTDSSSIALPTQPQPCDIVEAGHPGQATGRPASQPPDTDRRKASPLERRRRLAVHRHIGFGQECGHRGSRRRPRGTCRLRVDQRRRRSVGSQSDAVWRPDRFARRVDRAPARQDHQRVHGTGRGQGRRPGGTQRRRRPLAPEDRSCPLRPSRSASTSDSRGGRS